VDPIAVAFGVTSALSWGAGDFAGGLASRSFGSLPTATASRVLGVVLLTVMTVAVGERPSGQVEIAAAVVAGIGGGIGIAAFYAALARGEMSLVAPITGAIAVGIPVAVSVAIGESISALQLAGVACGLGAIVLVSLDARRAGDRRLALSLVIVAGVGFAVFFVAIDRASADTGHVWLPLLVAQSTALVLYLGLLLARGVRPAPGAIAQHLPLLLAVGLGDLGGNVFFVLADVRAPLSIAVVLASLYPVVTAIAAWLLLGERLRGVQLVGAGLAAAAIALIAI
jgi:drug/metabolite transporter (DMT)-like permease